MQENLQISYENVQKNNLLIRNGNVGANNVNYQSLNYNQNPENFQKNRQYLTNKNNFLPPQQNQNLNLNNLGNGNKINQQQNLNINSLRAGLNPQQNLAINSGTGNFPPLKINGDEYNGRTPLANLPNYQNKNSDLNANNLYPQQQNQQTPKYNNPALNRGNIQGQHIQFNNSVLNRGNFTVQQMQLNNSVVNNLNTTPQQHQILQQNNSVLNKDNVQNQQFQLNNTLINKENVIKQVNVIVLNGQNLKNQQRQPLQLNSSELNRENIKEKDKENPTVKFGNYPSNQKLNNLVIKSVNVDTPSLEQQQNFPVNHYKITGLHPQQNIFNRSAAVNAPTLNLYNQFNLNSLNNSVLGLTKLYAQNPNQNNKQSIHSSLTVSNNSVLRSLRLEQPQTLQQNYINRSILLNQGGVLSSINGKNKTFFI